ncbi:MAG TPA: hypothetical protein VFM21_02675 [Terriglobia bacterium]|nr:hypothetical protein [Terriglobia bacterium]
MNDNPPSRAYYGVAGAVLVGGVGLFVALLWRGISSVPSKVQQVVAPGRAELTLSKPGDYTIFYEYQSVLGNRVYSTGQNVPGLECTLVSKSAQEPVPLSRATVNSNYSFGGRSGKSVFDFHINQPGVYELTASYPVGEQGEEVVLAVGQGVVTGILSTVFGALAIMFGTIGLTIAIILITAVKRHNAAKRLQTAGGPPPPIE